MDKEGKAPRRRFVDRSSDTADERKRQSDSVTDDEPRVYALARAVGRRAFLKRVGAAAAITTVSESCGSSPASPPTSPSPPAPAPTPAPAPAPSLTRSLSGTVSDFDAAITLPNRVVSGAQITVVDGPATGRSAITDSQGRYTLTMLPEGSFHVRISATGYISPAGAAQIASDQQQAPFALFRERFSLTGRVISGISKLPIAGADVIIGGKTTTLVSTDVVKTGTDGTYSTSRPWDDSGISVAFVPPRDPNCALLQTSANITRFRSNATLDCSLPKSDGCSNNPSVCVCNFVSF